MFSPYFDIFCDLLLNLPIATWILFFHIIKNQNNFIGDVIYAFVLHQTLFATFVRVLSRGLFWIKKELSCSVCSLGITCWFYSFILVTAVIAVIISHCVRVPSTK